MLFVAEDEALVQVLRCGLDQVEVETVLKQYEEGGPDGEAQSRNNWLEKVRG